MKRLLFWIQKCLGKRERSCRYICMTCQYFEECSDDGSYQIRGMMKHAQK